MLAELKLTIGDRSFSRTIDISESAGKRATSAWDEIANFSEKVLRFLATNQAKNKKKAKHS